MLLCRTPCPSGAVLERKAGFPGTPGRGFPRNCFISALKTCSGRRCSLPPRLSLSHAGAIWWCVVLTSRSSTNRDTRIRPWVTDPEGFDGLCCRYLTVHFGNQSRQSAVRPICADRTIKLSFAVEHGANSFPAHCT